MTAGSATPRLATVDAARGVALAGMIVFHSAWDLRSFGLIELDPNRSPVWQVYGHAVASTFLFLSGLSLVLARQRGACAASALRRIGVVAGAALAVTAVTWVVIPDQVVLFGILHCIALCNLIALPLLRAPVAALLGSAALAGAAPIVLGHVLPEGFWWTGLSPFVPTTLDFRPLLPWLCPVLLGVAFARQGGAPRLERLRIRGAVVASPLAWSGRHSLAIYLLHQPALFAILYAALALPLGLRGIEPPLLDASQSSAFIRQCQADCEVAGAQPNLCVSICQCVLDAITERKTPDHWLELRSAPISRKALDRLAPRCLDALAPGSRP